MLVHRTLSIARLTPQPSAVCRQTIEPKPLPLCDDDWDLNMEPIYEINDTSLRTPMRESMNPFFGPSALLTRFYSVESSNTLAPASSRNRILSTRDLNEIQKDARLPSSVIVCSNTRGSAAGSKFQILIKIALKSVVSGRFVCADPVGMCIL
jgi:hypothetical protein